MTQALISFSAAFLFSFIGSIPPGTLNLTVIQLGLENRAKLAWRFAFAAALIEYPYAWLAIHFESLIAAPGVERNMRLIAGLVMIIFGILNYRSSAKVKPQETRGGFRRGLVMSVLNPMALPFWIAATAYLKSLRIIMLSSAAEIQLYLFGVVLGAFTLLILFAHLSAFAVRYLKNQGIVRKIPAFILMALGTYALLSLVLES